MILSLAVLVNFRFPFGVITVSLAVVELSPWLFEI